MALITSSVAYSVSKGTPGKENNRLSLPNLSFLKLNCIIGAVPILLGITVQFSGTYACWRLMSSICIPLADNKFFMILYCFWLRTYLLLRLRVIRTFLVMSSFVGPKPPVVMTISLRLRHRLSVLRMSFFESEQEAICMTLIPILLRALARKAELVSVIWPMRISSPIVRIVAVIISKLFVRSATFFR